MPAPTKINYESIKEVLDKIKREKYHVARRAPIDNKNLKKGYLWPSISMMLIAKKSGVNAKTLYRHCKKDEKTERLLRPFRKKTWNAENAKKNEAPKYGTKAWLEGENGRLRAENEKLKKKGVDLKIKNLQIDECNKTIDQQAETIANASQSVKEALELKRELDRVRSENSRLRKMLMVGK